MKIRDILAEGKPTLSFEVFPPKTQDAFASVEKAAEEIARLHPAFMSVTYGAGGGTSDYTVKIASDLQENCGVTPLAHLTCVSSTREKVQQVLNELKEHKIENILALRGDIPQDGQTPQVYHYASELIREIREAGDFCIGAACYPEGHVESANKSVDMDYLKQKVEAGCDFVTTQMFLTTVFSTAICTGSGKGDYRTCDRGDYAYYKCKAGKAQHPDVRLPYAGPLYVPGG